MTDTSQSISASEEIPDAERELIYVIRCGSLTLSCGGAAEALYEAWDTSLSKQQPATVHENSILMATVTAGSVLS